MVADALMLPQGTLSVQRRKHSGDLLHTAFRSGLLQSACKSESAPCELAFKERDSLSAIEKALKKEGGCATARPVAACKDAVLDPDSYTDDNSLWAVSISIVKIAICFLSMMVTTLFWSIIMLLLFPWPYARIKQGNIYGHVTGRMLMWILGNPINISGSQYANTKAIYVCNHASPLDIFLVMWLTPTGTVGIAKKEIIWYPLFGQLYVLANHLRIDRFNSNACIHSMRVVAEAVVKKNLSLIIFPEGTRSAAGRLLPFKKGFVHLAMQTKRPIVPMVVTGTHLAWQKNSLHVRPAPLSVTYLPPIETEDWTMDKVDEYAEMVHDLFVKHLPNSQKPLEKVQSS